MSEHLECDIIIVGAGPAGQIAALSLHNQGFKTALIGPDSPQDQRTTALMMPSLRALPTPQIAQTLMDMGGALKRMRIIDMTARIIRSPLITFNPEEIDEDAFGYNIKNNDLNAILKSAIEAIPSIVRIKETVENWQLGEHKNTIFCTNGLTLSAPLCIGADGRNSPARTAAQISLTTKELPQCAFVTNFQHQKTHENISTEFHTPFGPFTQVPLASPNHSSLVWVTRQDESETLKTLTTSQLALKIENMMQSMLGRVEIENDNRQAFPLSTRIANQFSQNRIMLIGEAAHVFPPIGAQGLNLTIRDVQDVTKAAQTNHGDPGCPQAINTYNKLRARDVSTRARAVSALNHSLLSSFLPIQIARYAGFNLLNALPPLRSALMRKGLAKSTS